MRGAWRELAGPPARFGTAPGVRVAVAPASRLCPPGWCGVVVVAGAVLATAPDPARARALEPVLDDLLAARPPGPVRLTAASVTALATALATAFPVGDVLGPTDLAYSPAPVGRPADDAAPVRALAGTDPLVAALLAACPADDVAEAAVEATTSPVFAVVRDGAALAVAGYERWPGGVAHLSVLTRPDARGAGLARAVAAVATDHAHRAGLLPQWRARPPASVRVARVLGYRSLGQQLSLRLGT
ncbi:GNAT superfamily N-acetyltransferase [Kineococcus radiotolerans]|uniref:GNAT superfamily N-acetyltransferase n=1 Tax=Kineococcus radiotolerans TaxID=131568 RepID=A0A7W4TML7_KINRA|nr:GNAT family N-acetyltransferase [Kineococcus radiotolerans]MBB2901709.1 GNAT superfamily N-acetyltransferase [Kineococcus radiotolerans]